MSRQPIRAGEHGRIAVTPQVRDGSGLWRTAEWAREAHRWRARCYLRGYDGASMELSRVAKTRAAARAALQTAIAERLPERGELTPGMKVPVAGAVWLAQMDRTDSGLSRRTVDTYRRAWTRYIDTPGSRIRGLTLAEANHPHRLRLFLQQVADTYGTGAAKTSRSVLSGILWYAVDGGTLATNALRNVRQVRSQTPTPAGRRDGLVFPSPYTVAAERPWDQSNCAGTLAHILAGCGMGWATPHTFRRTVATLLDYAGIPLSQIADQLGHADPAMTAAVYLGRDWLGDKAALAAHL